MVVNDLDLIRVAISPSKTDPPLVVDANTVLAATIVGRRNIVKRYYACSPTPRVQLRSGGRTGAVILTVRASRRADNLMPVAPTAMHVRRPRSPRRLGA